MTGIANRQIRHQQRMPSRSDSKIHPVDLHIGQQIRILRIQSDLSQGDLGESVGVSFQQMQKYESGKNRVSASMLYKIAGCLRIPVARLYEGLPEPGDGNLDHVTTEIDERIAYISSAEGRRLVEDILILSPRVKSRIVSIVGILAEE